MARDRHAARGTSQQTMTRLKTFGKWVVKLRLLHFVIIGGVLFAALAKKQSNRQIEISDEQLRAVFAAHARREGVA